MAIFWQPVLLSHVSTPHLFPESHYARRHPFLKGMSPPLQRAESPPLAERFVVVVPSINVLFES